MLSLRPSVLIVMFGVQSVLTVTNLPEPENNSHDREYLLYQAKLAEKAERYDDMVESMKQVTVLEIELSVEERKSLAFAYNHVIGHRRASLRKLTSTDNEADNPDTKKIEIFINYKERIKKEIREICRTVIAILDNNPIPSSASAEVFFYTMKGNYHRYLAEVEDDAGRKEEERGASFFYQTALDIAMGELAPTDPIRVELALNLAIFNYENLNLPDEACRFANEAYVEANVEQNTLSEEDSKDLGLLIQTFTR